MLCVNIELKLIMELYLSTHCQFTMICVYLCSDDVVVDVMCEHCTREWNCISLLTVSLR